jgi:hypothetical protein
MNDVLRVIEDWIMKNKPTPDPSREGNLKENNFVYNDKYITDLTGGQIIGEKKLIGKDKPTPDPSREGNL